MLVSKETNDFVVRNTFIAKAESWRSASDRALRLADELEAAEIEMTPSDACRMLADYCRGMADGLEAKATEST